MAQKRMRRRKTQGMPRVVDKLAVVTDTVQKEITGWDQFAKDEGWLEPPDDYILYLPEPKVIPEGDTLHWDIHAENFYRAISGIDWTGKKVLDVAAGRTWSSKELALRGAHVTATDILVKDGIGLETAYRYFEKFNIRYELVRCDMNNLPFADESFDIVFVHASVHHSEKLSQALQEMRRVCKKGGIILLSTEMAGSFYTRLLNKYTVKGIGYGIHETSPRLREYLEVFADDDAQILPARQLGWRNRFNILSFFGGTFILRVVKSDA